MVADVTSVPGLAISDDREGAAKPFAIFTHVFYPDVWNNILARIEAVVVHPFHLVVTAPASIADELRMPTSHLLVSSHLVPCENRGRDIRPFCQALRLPIDFDIGLKLHTKRSLHRLDGADWGQTLVNDLLPNADAVERLRRTMIDDPRIALLAPDGMLVSQKAWMGTNRRAMRRLAPLLSLDLESGLAKTPVFCAGSMFWFRRQALQPLAAAPLDDLFETEAGQVDGTIAHALERLTALVAEKQGQVVTTMEGAFASSRSTPAAQLREAALLLADRPNPFLTRPHALARFAASTPVVREVYRNLPVSWRRQLKRFLIPSRAET